MKDFKSLKTRKPAIVTTRQIETLKGMNQTSWLISPAFLRTLVEGK
ncbi:hypothetical protein ACWD7C_34055 [Streptomyces sp. NPDC005134]